MKKIIVYYNGAMCLHLSNEAAHILEYGGIDECGADYDEVKSNIKRRILSGDGFDTWIDMRSYIGEKSGKGEQYFD
jgi:hypothetical protein